MVALSTKEQEITLEWKGGRVLFYVLKKRKEDLLTW